MPEPLPLRPSLHPKVTHRDAISTSLALSFPMAQRMWKAQRLILTGSWRRITRCSGCCVPVVACPAAGDMNENASRVSWAGAGVALPRRLTTPRGVRLALRKLLSDGRYARRAAEMREWALANDGAATAAAEVEALAACGERAVSA